MARRDQRHESDIGQPARAPTPAGPELGATARAFESFQAVGGPSAQDVLALQQSAGNAAVSRMLARQPAAAGPGAAGLIVDDDAEPPAGGIRRSEFVAQVRRVVPASAAGMLAAYANADARTLEQLLREHLPETAAASSAQEYLDAIAERARGGSLLGGIGGMLGLQRRDDTGLQASLARHEQAHGAAAPAATPPSSRPMTILRRWAAGRRIAREHAGASLLGCDSKPQQTHQPPGPTTSPPTTTPATPPATTPATPPATTPPQPAGPTPPRPTTGAAPLAAGASPPASATDAVQNPVGGQAASAQTGGSQDAWFDEVTRNNLGLSPPANTDAYDWLIRQFVTVRVFGQQSGPVLPRFATKLQRASARAEQMIRERLNANGQTVAGALTEEQWNVRSVSGWAANRLRGSHAFGQATDIDYYSNPYVAHEAGDAEQPVDRASGPAYDRAVILFGDGQRLLSVVPNGNVGSGADRIERNERITNVARPAAHGTPTGRESIYNQTLRVYNQLASDSMAMQHYFALVYPPPDLNSMTPTPATPHNIDAAAIRPLLPRIQALPVAALRLLFDGNVPATIDEASVAAALRPIIERDYVALGGTSTNAGTAGDRPFATRGGADQRAMRDPRRGFMTLPFEVVHSLRAEGLRWGACDLGGASGDIQHFDDAFAFPIPRRP